MLSGRWARSFVRVVACGLLAATGPGCAYDRVHDETVIQWYDLDEDVELGQATLDGFLRKLDEKGIPYDQDTRTLGLIRDITRRVAKVSHYPELPWEAHLAELSDANAWCAPGGKIVVYRGLFDPKTGLVATTHELAAILAHECAHATCRHTTRARSRHYTLLVAAFPVTVGLAVFVPFAGDAFGLAFQTGLGLYLPSYSRDQEEEADRIGLTYMAKAGYDPRAAPRIWERAAKRGESDGLYATHPDHAARAAALREALPAALEIYRATLRRHGREPGAP